jgi:hypothetical protein
MVRDGAVDTTITGGPTAGEMLRTNTTTFTFSHTNGNGNFECKLDSGTNQTNNWTACNTGSVTYNSMVDRPHTFAVRALGASGSDPTPATRSFKSWNCGATDDANTQNLTVGEDIDAAVNGDATGTATEFCVHGGSHTNISATVRVQNGDSLEGEPGTISTFEFPDGVVAAHAVDAPAEISDSQTANGSGLAGLSNIIQLNGTASISWIDCSGAHAQDSNGAATPGGTPQDGTGVCLKPGQGNESQPDHTFLEIHDNGAKGYGTTFGGIKHSHFYGNTENDAFIGFDGSSGKSTQEYEAAYNYVHNEEGMGLWCDADCTNRTSQGEKGFWAHHNLVFGNDEFGIRNEQQAKSLGNGTDGFALVLCEGHPTGTRAGIPNLCDPVSTPNSVIENNIALDNNDGGLVCQAVQNCIIRDNWFPAPLTYLGNTWGHNGAAPSGSTGKAIQIANSAKTTEIYNVDVYDNAIGSEGIQGCQLNNSLFPSAEDDDLQAYCHRNNSSDTANGTYDDGADSVQDNNSYGYSTLP